MDLQNALNSVMTAMRDTRRNYHLILGDLIKILEAAPSDTMVSSFYYDEQCAIRGAVSYRGYYHDLAMLPDRDNHEMLARDLLAMLKNDVLNHTFYGYKGGEYVMDEDSILWLSEAGSVSDHAIVGVRPHVASPKNKLILDIKIVD